MSFEGLQERLAALQETTSQLKELIDRLATLKFQPGSVPYSADEEDNVMTELSSEIGQILREEEEDLELLQEEIADLRTGKPGSETEHKKTRLQDGVGRLEGELKSSRVAFRKAQIAARHSLEQAQRLERELILASYSASAVTTPQNRSGASSPALGSAAAAAVAAAQQQDPQSPTIPQQQPQLNAGQARAQLFGHHRRRLADKARGEHGRDNEAVGAAANVTSSLRRMHDLMSVELARSTFAQQTLDESNAAMKELGDRYAGVAGLLSTSRELLGTLVRSTKSDTWYLETALYMLLGTLAWLVFRRWLYGPLWWIVWLPVRTVFGTGWRVGRMAVGSAGGGSQGARMEIVGGGTDGQKEGARVVGMDDGAVPTMKAGGVPKDGNKEKAGSGSDSMVEQVGKIVDRIEENLGDGGAEEQNESTTADQGDAPNPNKRMWEEGHEAAREAEMARDEL